VKRLTLSTAFVAVQDVALVGHGEIVFSRVWMPFNAQLSLEIPPQSLSLVLIDPVVSTMIATFHGPLAPPNTLAVAVAEIGIDVTPNTLAKNVGTVALSVT
jgi:hypothetical protein